MGGPNDSHDMTAAPAQTAGDAGPSMVRHTTGGAPVIDASVMEDTLAPSG